MIATLDPRFTGVYEFAAVVLPASAITDHRKTRKNAERKRAGCPDRSLKPEA